MTKKLSWMSFGLGACIVLWMGYSFATNSLLALLVTAAIAGVYSLGFSELMRYQGGSRQLQDILSNTHAPVPDLNTWLLKVPASLQLPVNQRIRQGQAVIPTPVLSPYLIGLLVMLGLIGTFIGMVSTLKGAVIALESNTELEAIRSGLAAPMQGLSMAFGTSVAGVSASAALGLIATLSRRERLGVWRQLEASIPYNFANYSPAEKRQQTFDLLNQQGQHWPQLVERMDRLAERLETMGTQVGKSLEDQQNQSLQATATVVTDMVAAVQTRLTGELGDTARQMTEAVEPVVSRLLNEGQQQLAAAHREWQASSSAQLEQQLASMQATTSAIQKEWQESGQHFRDWQSQQADTQGATLQALQERLTSAHQAWQTSSNEQQERQLEVLNTTTKALQDAWQQAGTSYRELQDSIAQNTEASLASLNEQLTEAHQQWQDSSHLQMERQLEALQSASNALQYEWQEAGQGYREMQNALASHQDSWLVSLQSELSDHLNQLHHGIDERLDEWLGKQATVDEERLSQINTLGEQNLKQSLHALEGFSASLNERQDQQLQAIERIVTGGETLLEARKALEARSLETQQEAVQTFIATAREELVQLREAEIRRGDATVNAMTDLQEAMKTQLVELTQALQTPLSELLATASESPKAAAEVLSQLREEMSASLEKDNQMLQERQKIMSQLDTLATSLAESTQSQRDAIAAMATDSGRVLAEVTEKFQASVDADIDRLAAGMESAAASSIEMASLAETFRESVQTYQEANTHLFEHFAGLEAQIQGMNTRSDEQMAYYVAQAREIIDHSLSSQQEMIAQLRKLGSESVSAS